ncbi:elongin C [Histomonas meleagridis]|uniref:elongin C n=1 Tax=Histomonas meleagridis TaxID=135588 RepID=UPI00355A5E4D|nr:elongin C [Histomonas meleagridis]KAH0797181.1 elongin C [Histomonas meleagridis]
MDTSANPNAEFISEDGGSDEPEKEEEDFNEPLGPQDYIKIISNDGSQFFLEKEIAFQSSILKSLFNDSLKYQESLTNEIRFPQFSGPVVEKLIDYLHFLYLYKDDPEQISKFQVDNSLLLELVVASDYLHI